MLFLPNAHTIKSEMTFLLARYNKTWVPARCIMGTDAKVRVGSRQALPK